MWNHSHGPLILWLFFDDGKKRFTLHTLFLFEFIQLLPQDVLVPLSQPSQTHTDPSGKTSLNSKNPQSPVRVVVWYAPGSCHVDPHLLQETLPVADVQVGASGLDLILDVHIKSLKLTVRLPFKHALHVCADGCVYALTTVTWHDTKNRDDEGLLCTGLSWNILNSIMH